MFGRANTDKPPAPPLARRIGFKRNWEKTVIDLEEKISSTEARRAALSAERDDLVLAAVEGDAAASRQADTLDVQLDAVLP